jgi:hypothetical protein
LGAFANSAGGAARRACRGVAQDHAAVVIVIVIVIVIIVGKCYGYHAQIVTGWHETDNGDRLTDHKKDGDGDAKEKLDYEISHRAIAPIAWLKTINGPSCPIFHPRRKKFDAHRLLSRLNIVKMEPGIGPSSSSHRGNDMRPPPTSK